MLHKMSSGRSFVTRWAQSAAAVAVVVSMAMAGLGVALPAPAYAQLTPNEQATPGSGPQTGGSPGTDLSTPNDYQANPAGESNDGCALVNRSKGGSGNTNVPTPSGGSKTCIAHDIDAIVNFLAVGVGIVIVIMIIVAGIRYTISRDNPQEVQAAKKMIFNALIALVAFAFSYAFLQWITPGGLF